MSFLILLIFCLVAMLCFVEEKLDHKASLILFVAIDVILILMAGLREVGYDPDSINYQNSYFFTRDLINDDVEFTFVWLSSVFSALTHDVHILFLFYALVGLTLKVAVFKQLSGRFFLPLLVYLSYYYELHEMMQIRTGILSGCFLLALKPIADRRRWLAFLLIMIGTCFHYSGLMLLPMIFLSDNPLSGWRKWMWLSVVPLSYVIYFGGGSILFNPDFPILGPKLVAYQTAAESGLLTVHINVFSPFHLLSVFVFYYLAFFSDTITPQNRYFPLLFKIYALGLFAFVAFAFLPVLGERSSYLIRVVTVVLYPCIYYTMKPSWASKLIVLLLCVLYLNYGMSYFDFVLLFKVGG